MSELDQTKNKSHTESPNNSVLEFSQCNLNTPQLSPPSNINISISTEDQAENLVNNILDFNLCKEAAMSQSPQTHEDVDWEERQQEEKDHF